MLTVTGASIGFFAHGIARDDVMDSVSQHVEADSKPPAIAKRAATAHTDANGAPPTAEHPSRLTTVAALKAKPAQSNTSIPNARKSPVELVHTGSTKARDLPVRPGSVQSVTTDDKPAAKTKNPEPDADAAKNQTPKSDADAAKIKNQDADAEKSDRTGGDNEGGQKTAEQNPAQINLDTLLKPVRDYTISKADLKNVGQAIKWINRSKAKRGQAAMRKIKDDTARQFIRWYGLAKDVFPETPEKLEAFRKENPDWPELDRLRKNAERILLLANPPAARLRKFFENQPPLTGAGIAGQAIVHLAAGDKDKAKELAVKAWRHHHLSRRLESAIYKRLGSVLTKKDHKYRTHRILYSRRKGQASAALRMAKHLNKKERRKVQARAATLRKSRKAGGLLSALPAEAKKDPGILFSRIQWLRRKKRYAQAWALLKSQPSDKESLIDPDAWWLERRALLREALDRGKVETAYRIAKNHGPVTVNSLNEAEFLAGWIALRFQKDAKTAKPHFEALSKSADGPRSRSRAHYWRGRTAKALNEMSEANRHFANGGKYFNTFYGQLSLREAEPNMNILEIGDPPVPTDEDIKRFLNRPSVKAVIIAKKAGANAVASRLLNGFRKLLKSPGELLLAAELGKQIGHTQQSLRIGKTGMFYGHALAEYAYPTHTLPEFKPLRPLPEKSIFYAVTRQESEFNTQVKSHVGARGLMQVMPATAKHVARQHKVKYQLKKLTSDPVYNLKIATAYIADRLDEFKGSYVKSLVGFNAGPGRVRQWVEKLGDPSDPSVDPIDWIERIPFTETRNYVKKVLANVQVYRARLGNPEQALQIDLDLLRGVRGKAAAIKRASN